MLLLGILEDFLCEPSWRKFLVSSGMPCSSAAEAVIMVDVMDHFEDPAIVAPYTGPAITACYRSQPTGFLALRKSVQLCYKRLPRNVQMRCMICMPLVWTTMRTLNV
jgi:hypothetical protein